MTDFDPAVFGSPSVRVGTAEREQAAAALGDHFAAGRLELDEYDERVSRAYAAKTAADLIVLFGDLPRPQPAPPARPRREARRARPVFPALLLAAVVVAVVIVATTHIIPFFVFPALFFLFIHHRRGYGPPGYGPRRHYRV
ncbi:hypothetical protein J2W56_003233 [Nocardia kruczakiae]|uniref:DUF1707 domain-containing protein n=1 Tax=Nocardia kruczakiae TaxID=261477 RepID=A0ABU1XG13_9NOCA|nr:DUF1707 domain-containing protein [Nocardia kruczakiae]MDR7169492.1 hypothetical protein [Nocardia kruczakiae]